MSHRPPVKSAFANLRPSIVREPARTAIAPEDESKLLSTGGGREVTIQAAGEVPAPAPEPALAEAPPPAFLSAPLLTKKKREVLIPLTFRIPHTLKERLNEVARRHELSQTDLINEGIALNLERYR